MNSHQFPLLHRFSLDRKGFSSSLSAILDARYAGSMRHIDYDRCRRIISASIYSAWRKHVEERFLTPDDITSMSVEQVKIAGSIKLVKISDVILVGQMLSSPEYRGSAIDATREILTEATPIVRDLNVLSKLTYRGRTSPRQMPNPCQRPEVMAPRAAT